MVPPPSNWRRLPTPLFGSVAIALIVAFFWAYCTTFEHLAQRWWRDSQASHGFIVPLFAGLVLWSRKQTFPTLAMQPSYWGAAAVGIGAFFRLFGAYIYIDWLDGAS